MRFQIGGLIGEQSIGRGMGFIEAVSGKLCHQIKDLFDLFLWILAFQRSPHKSVTLLGHFFRLLLAHGPAQQVCFSQ